MTFTLSSASSNECGRVTYLSTGLALGGGETQVVRLAMQMRVRNWDVSVISMLPPQAYMEDLKAAGIRMAALDMSQGIPDPRALVRLASLLKQHPPQVLHCHMIHANLLGRLVRLLVPVPVVICTAHSTYESPRGASHTREVTSRDLAYRLTDPLCDLTTQVSRAGLERYQRIKAVSREKSKCVPNGIDIERFYPNDVVRDQMRVSLGLNAKFVWLAVGRFEEAKDYPNLIQAFAQIDRPGVVLLIVGEGTTMNAVQKLSADCGLGNRVRFLGVRRDVHNIMTAADAYVMSSFYEGLPMVLLEAAATGLPIVATDVGGNREVVQDGQTGYLALSRNPQALAQAMARLMDLSGEERTRMGKLGRAFVEREFSMTRVGEQWEMIYRKLLASKAGAES